MKTKKITIENLEKEIAERKLLIEKLKWCKEFKETGIQELILKKYIDMQSVVKVADELNFLGYRLKSTNGERKYIPNDITAALANKENETNQELFLLAKMVQLHNRGKQFNL